MNKTSDVLSHSKYYVYVFLSLKDDTWYNSRMKERRPHNPSEEENELTKAELGREAAMRLLNKIREGR